MPRYNDNLIFPRPSVTICAVEKRASAHVNTSPEPNVEMTKSI